jgi:hypothetical protein
VKGVPLSHRLVGYFQGIVGVLLVVEEAPRADRVVPNLHLRIAAQVDAAVSLAADLPIHPQLEVAIVLRRLQTLPLPVVNENAFLDRPVRQVFLIRFLLLRPQLLGRQLGPFGQLHEPLPTVEVLAVKEQLKPLRRLIIPRPRLLLLPPRARRQQNRPRETYQRKIFHEPCLHCFLVSLSSCDCPIERGNRTRQN